MNFKNSLSVCFWFFLLLKTSMATTYYFDQIRGNDQNSGTSALSPFRTLHQASDLELLPGDLILLASGQTFHGTLQLEEVQGTFEHPIVITSYNDLQTQNESPATINAIGYLNAILLRDCSHILVKDLAITADGGSFQTNESKEITMRCGVLVTTSQVGLYTGITLRNLRIKDVFFEEKGFERGKDEVRTANGSQRYGWGIRFINRIEGALLKQIEVHGCRIENIAHTGIKFTGRNQGIEDIKVLDNRVLDTGGPGIQISGVLRGHIKGNYVIRSGSNDDSRKWGRGSGLWTWSSSDIIVENNHFMYASGPADSAGCHIDFNCKNVVVQYNFSAHNAGGFCEILGNNHNCAYRYNVSVNDGHRIKGVDGAFQEGKTFWLSGYVGRQRKRHGPYNSYFYNNTIYASMDIVSKLAVTKTAVGVLVTNNIFCIEGDSKAVLGDQYNPEKEGGGDVDNVIFENNLFLKPTYWPAEVLIQPANILTGDPLFFNQGGLDITDYVPGNVGLIKDRGIQIPYIPSDTIGLTVGLNVEYDILGNPVIGRPDMGAIELE